MLPLLLPAPPPVDYLLRHVRREGEMVQYQMKNKSDLVLELPGGAGDQEMGIEGDTLIIYKFGKLTSNGRKVRIVNRLKKMDMTGPAAAAAPKISEFPDIVFDGRLDSLNRLKVLPNDDLMGGSPMAQIGSSDPSNYFAFLPLPADRVGVGSTWPVVLLQAKSTIVARFESVENGIAVIRLKGKMEKEDTMPGSEGEEVPVAFRGKMISKSTADIDGTVHLDVATGVTVKADAKIAVRNQTSVGTYTVDVTGSGNSTWQRL
ncbi:hypothetical protein EON79_11485 [bacterium]|nr:MAG: hypothetical protein EON79_11485 [bacterium]